MNIQMLSQRVLMADCRFNDRDNIVNNTTTTYLYTQYSNTHQNLQPLRTITDGRRLQVRQIMVHSIAGSFRYRAPGYEVCSFPNVRKFYGGDELL